MAKHSRIWNREKYEEYIREGRGQGSGVNYKAWVQIQDFGSQGIVSRAKGLKTGRIHHLMSNNELAYFYLLEWSDDVIDIREQYPLLDLNCAVDCAAQAGIKYPKDNISGFPYVLTCDFMITTAQGFKARTIKMSAELSDRRVLEKLEIERRYWNMRGIEWKIVTENEISFIKAKNIEWLYSAQDFKPENESDRINDAMKTMLEMLDAAEYYVMKIIKAIEEKYSLSEGIGLLLYKYLALNKRIGFDLGGPVNLNILKKVSVIK